eukprot:73368_1
MYQTKKMLKGLQKLLMYNKSNSVQYSSPIVDVAFGRREPYLVTNRAGAKLGCASRGVEVQRSVTVPQAHYVLNNNLNQKQSEAVDIALAMQDIGIIHGPPGTGKTTVVVEIICRAVSLGWQVLIAAPSNTAVDNILEKLISVTPDQEGHRRKSKKKTSATTASKTGAIKVVRLGHPARISKTAQKYSLEALVKKDDDMTVVDDIKDQIAEVVNNEKSTKGERNKIKDMRKEAKSRGRKVV